MQATTTSAFAPSAHMIQRPGLGYRGILSTDDLRKCVPGAFAENKAPGRSERYAYVPTIDIIDGLRNAGFMPVKAQQANARDEAKKDFGKHLIRFRREDQLGATEAREIILKNSHDGTSAYEMDAGIFRLVCSNGLVVGNSDTQFKVRHSGQAVSDVIDVASRIIDNFDAVQSDIELMKSTQLDKTLQLTLAKAAIAARFGIEDEAPVNEEQILRVRRAGDIGDDAWRVMNRAQEAVIKGGLFGVTTNAVGRTVHRRTREVKGIDQNQSLNRAMWVIGVQMAKLQKGLITAEELMA